MNKIQHLIPLKVNFEPSNKNHMKMVKDFFRDNKWGEQGCPFYLDWPYADMPYMLKTKIADFYLRDSK